jgi:predicted tellurium resistance membrane protein TerC
MFGIIGALVMRAAFIAAGISLLEAAHPVIYVFGAVLLLAAFNMLLGMRSLYFLLVGAGAKLRYLRPGLAVILGGVAVKLLLADVWEFPAWSAPAFITVVLAVAAVASVRDSRGRPQPDDPQPDDPRPDDPAPSDRRAAGASAPHDQAHAAAREG